MNGSDAHLYLYSEEGAAPGLPVRVRIARYLALGEVEEKAAVLALESAAYREELTTVVVLAKGPAVVSEAFGGTEVGVYVLPLDARAGEEALQLAGGLQPVLDWGALTNDPQRALCMQVKQHAA